MYTHCIFLFHIIQKSTDILEILAHISILMSFKLNIILIASLMLDLQLVCAVLGCARRQFMEIQFNYRSS